MLKDILKKITVSTPLKIYKFGILNGVEKKKGTTKVHLCISFFLEGGSINQRQQIKNMNI